MQFKSKVEYKAILKQIKHVETITKSHNRFMMKIYVKSFWMKLIKLLYLLKMLMIYNKYKKRLKNGKLESKHYF